MKETTKDRQSNWTFLLSQRIVKKKNNRRLTRNHLHSKDVSYHRSL